MRTINIIKYKRKSVYNDILVPLVMYVLILWCMNSVKSEFKKHTHFLLKLTLFVENIIGEKAERLSESR